MRKRLTYANVAATLALVFSMSGGALAASHYLINSTKQINPKVLKKLKGNPGKTGAVGKEGAQGKQGQAGNEGLTGKEGAPATALWAVVNANGTLARGKGVLKAENNGGGSYDVQFDQDITKCAFIATVGLSSFNSSEAGDVDVSGDVGTTDSVFVDTRSNTGTKENKGFHLAVFC